MAINLFTAPLATSPAVFASPVVSELALLVRNIDHQNRFKYGFVRKGAMFNIGGSLFVADSDTAISGTYSGFIKLTVSGTTATASYVSGSPSVTWDDENNGYYDGSGNYYAFDDSGVTVISNISTVDTSNNVIKTATAQYREFSGNFTTLARFTIPAMKTAQRIDSITLRLQNSTPTGVAQIRVFDGTTVFDSWSDVADITRDITFNTVIPKNTSKSFDVQWNYGYIDYIIPLKLTLSYRTRPSVDVELPPVFELYQKDVDITFVDI